MTDLAPELRSPAIELLLAVADDKLVLGHSNSDWTGLAPILEEDIAFSSLAQDEIAHALALYELVGSIDGRTPDQLAFGRPVEAYRCAQLFEIPDEFNWALAIARQFCCDHFDALRLQRLARSSWKPLADLAARLAAEEQVHVEHADAWIRRLGRGGAEAAERLQSGLDRLRPLAAGLFEPTEGQDRLEAAGVYPPLDRPMFDAWSSAVGSVADDAGLAFEPERPDPTVTGGRRGRHGEHLAALLDEMGEVFRLAPDAAW